MANRNSINVYKIPSKILMHIGLVDGPNFLDDPI